MKFPEFIKRLARAPIELPPGYTEVLLYFKGGRLTVLCPVNSMNKLPKSNLYEVQGVFSFVDIRANCRGIIGPRGEVFRISTDYVPTIRGVITGRRAAEEVHVAKRLLESRKGRGKELLTKKPLSETIQRT